MLEEVKILALYEAEYVRDRAFAGTSGSGTSLLESHRQVVSLLSPSAQHFRSNPCLTRS